MTFDEEKKEFRWSLAPTKYATTIHAINSAVIKLSKLTIATSVYRGVAGMRLPASFFKKNADGTTGGVEAGTPPQEPSPEQQAAQEVVGEQGQASAKKAKRKKGKRGKKKKGR